MNKYNRRSRPNLRYSCEFYIPSTNADEYGELEQEFDLHYKGPFSLELPLNPIEVSDSGRIQAEQTFVLIGNWCRPAALITAGMFCVIPQLQKVFAVKGQATDQWGDRKKLKIHIIDNVSQPVTIQLLPTLY